MVDLLQGTPKSSRPHDSRYTLVWPVKVARRFSELVEFMRLLRILQQSHVSLSIVHKHNEDLALLVAITITAWVGFKLIANGYGFQKQTHEIADTVFLEFLGRILRCRCNLNPVTSSCAPKQKGESIADAATSDTKATSMVTRSPGKIDRAHLSVGCNEQSKSKAPLKPEEDTEPTNCLTHVDMGVEGVSGKSRTQACQQESHITIHHGESEELLTNELQIATKLEGRFKVALWRQSLRLFKPDIVWANPNFAFTKEDRYMLRAFDSGLKTCTDMVYARLGYHFPLLNLSLVLIESNSRKLSARMRSVSITEAYVCISGLESLNDIRSFDIFISKNCCKHSSGPWKLCYEESQIKRSAGPRSCNIFPATTRTLCGGLVTFSDADGSERKSTIGGMIEVDGQTFALTTSHRPEDEIAAGGDNDAPSLAELIKRFEDGEPESPSLSESSSPTIFPVSQTLPEFDEALDTPTVLGQQHVPAEDSSCEIVESWDPLEVWDDWELVLVEPAHRRPNLVLQSEPHADTENTKTRGEVITFVDFDIASFDGALPWSVLIISGTSGTIEGLLSSSPSYTLFGGNKTQELWNVRLLQGGTYHVPDLPYCNELNSMTQRYADLQAGDSGSWVIRESDHCLLGMVIARSAGSAYMVSFKRLRQSIEEAKGLAPNSIRLPTFSRGGVFSRSHACPQPASQVPTDLPLHRQPTLFTRLTNEGGMLGLHVLHTLLAYVMLWLRSMSNMISSKDRLILIRDSSGTQTQSKSSSHGSQLNSYTTTLSPANSSIVLIFRSCIVFVLWLFSSVMVPVSVVAIVCFYYSQVFALESSEVAIGFYIWLHMYMVAILDTLLPLPAGAYKDHYLSPRRNVVCQVGAFLMYEILSCSLFMYIFAVDIGMCGDASEVDRKSSFT
ncbi:hypothetical protein CMEL01_11655 [Colletotrichum melonis]|uniref:Uncharacterized protein n=1 Tax=Colletotrichum melonis TaxID=1209925 RepID=A0AAI9UY47_9PEZI|nr:hypothetical protein CMEL01_11655 [Colletotrichum melonis]